MENCKNLDSPNRRNPLILKGFDTKKPQNISETSVIPLGFEPKTHSLEGCCSNPTELRNQNGVQN